jgi:hypothetical protein
MPLKKQENEKVLNTLLIEHLHIKEKGIIPDGEIHGPSMAKSLPPAITRQSSKLKNS